MPQIQKRICEVFRLSHVLTVTLSLVNHCSDSSNGRDREFEVADVEYQRESTVGCTCTCITCSFCTPVTKKYPQTCVSVHLIYKDLRVLRNTT